MSSKDCEMGTRSNEGIDGSKSGLASISMRELIRLDRTVLFSILPIPFISYAVDRDERLGIIVAVISGIYVLFLTRNRVRLRWLLFLFGALFFGGATLGLITGSAKLFFATDPAEDFLTAIAMFVSIYINRPLAGLQSHNWIVSHIPPAEFGSCGILCFDIQTDCFHRFRTYSADFSVVIEATLSATPQKWKLVHNPTLGHLSVRGHASHAGLRAWHVRLPCWIRSIW